MRIYNSLHTHARINLPLFLKIHIFNFDNSNIRLSKDCDKLNDMCAKQRRIKIL